MKKWNSLNIPLQHMHFLERAYALAYLPAIQIVNGVDVLQNNLNNDRVMNQTDRTKIQKFITYLVRTWLPISEIVSCYQNVIKSNNLAENFHFLLNQKISSRPSLWKFLGKNIIFDKFMIYLKYYINLQLILIKLIKKKLFAEFLKEKIILACANYKTVKNGYYLNKARPRGLWEKEQKIRRSEDEFANG